MFTQYNGPLYRFCLTTTLFLSGIEPMIGFEPAPTRSSSIIAIPSGLLLRLISFDFFLYKDCFVFDKASSWSEITVIENV